MNRCPFWLVTAKFQNSTPYCEKVLAGQLLHPFIRTSKSVIGSRDWKLDGTGKWSAIVIQDAENLFIMCFAFLGKFFNKSGIVFFVCLLSFYPEVTAVNEDNDFLGHKA